MTTIASALIRNNYKFDLFSFEDAGDKFTVSVKPRGRGLTGMVQILLKANREKASVIGWYADNRSVSELEEHVREDLLAV